MCIRDRADSREDQEDETVLPIELSLTTKFKLATKKGKISYKTAARLSEPLPTNRPVIKIPDLFDIDNLEWHELRLGLEFFKAGFFGSMLGSAPTIFRRTQLSIIDQELTFLIEEAGLTIVSELIGSQNSFLSSLSTTLEDTKLVDDFASTIRKKLEKA